MQALETNYDLGSNHLMRYYSWTPDRLLKPEFENIPDIEKLGIFIAHYADDGRPCINSVMFATDEAQMAFPTVPKWRVESWDPLSILSEIQCHCGDHGFIREGKWCY